MNKICKLSAIALLASSTSLMAQTFSGPYVGVSVSAAGFGTDASKNSTGVSAEGTATPNSGNGPVGAVFGLAALDVGYGIPVGKDMTIAIGATYTPLEADFSGKSNDASTGTSHTFTIKNPYTLYLMPTFEINKDAAFFVKGFYSKADVKATNLTRAPGDLEGYGGSAGLKVMLTKNAFIQAEASYTQFDSISATDTPTTRTGALRTYTAQDPELVEGRLTIGYKF
jgi:outer membrane protein W